ncbi:MAG TPA: PilZ domain-containing protein [Nitrospira sp.]|nr:PilZ domain-containing protein [Nitrospira sp.]
MTTQRRQFRMPVSRCGLLTKDHSSTLCEIRDITDEGLQFSTDLRLSKNETVRIECQLDADCIIQCELVVTHAEPPCYGGRMTHLRPEHQQQLALFIQQLITSSMAGL